MSSESELDELFAYLDQLELKERLEQEQVAVPSSPGHEDTGLSSLPELGTSICRTLLSARANNGALTDVSPDGNDGTSPRCAETGSGGLDSTLPELTTQAPTTPPKRKMVQFNSAAPLRTPQRKAPKLVFTPLRPTQSTNQPIQEERAPETVKPVFEGVVLSPTNSSFLQSFVPVSPGSKSTQSADAEDSPVSIPREVLSDDALPSPTHSSLAVDDLLDVQDEDPRDSDFPSPSPPKHRPQRQAKKRVVYSSDEDTEQPASRVQLPSHGQDVAEIEYVGEVALSMDPQVEVNAKTTPPPKSRNKSRKAAKGVSRFIDAMARAAGKDDDEEDSDDAGSLDDFIVDDDYVEYEDAEEEEEENAYVLTYSPTTPKPRRATVPATVVTVDLTETSDEESSIPTISVPAPRPKPRAKPPPAKFMETPRKNRAEKKNWNKSKQSLACQIMDELDELVFDGKLVREWKVFPVWNNKLLTTAGRAHHKRTKISEGMYRHEGRIELSEKVIDDEDKLKNTVAHEMCHLATWIISGEMKNPHGAVFKSWGKKVMKARKDIVVTTKHSYEIAYKYEWECTTESCDAVYRRHSKSIDIETQACGKCRGRLRPMFKTRGGAGSGSTPFQDFLKQNMKLAKAAMPKATHGEVMRALSERWKATGGAKTPADIIQNGEDPLAVQRGHAEHWQVMSLRMGTLSIA